MIEPAQPQPPSVTVSDHWLPLPLATAGADSPRLLLRRWMPEHPRPNAAPVLLLHESLGCISMWRQFPAALAAHSQRVVLAYDRWGFGQSSPRSGPMPPDFVAQEAAHIWPLLQAQLGLTHFIAVGHSVGGGMALECAAQHPQACRAVVALSAQAFNDERTRQGIRQAIAPLRQPQTWQRLARHHGDKTEWVFSAWVDTWLSPGFAQWTLQDTLPRIHCPTLALHGSEDEYGSPEHPRHITQHVRGPAQLCLLPGLGHHPHLQDPAQTLQALSRFLSTVEA